MVASSELRRAVYTSNTSGVNTHQIHVLAETLILLVIPLSQTNLTTQLSPFGKPFLLHLPRYLNQLVKIPVTIPDELSFSSPLLDHLSSFSEDRAVDRDFRTGEWIQEGLD